MNNPTNISKGRIPLVSIILPVWNPRPDWLAAAIDSAFKESRCQIELILVDDGSDQSANVWLSSRDAQRICLIQVPHNGVGRARNIALAHCKGEYVRFLDGDDLILPESTSALLELAQGDANVVTYGSTVLCDPFLQQQGIVRSRLRGSIHLQTALGRFSSTIPALLIPRQLAVQVGFDEKLVVQGDWDFVLRLSEVVGFRGTTRSVYIYRRHEDSHSSGGAARREAMRSTVRIIRGYLERHPEIRGTWAERRIRAYAQFLIAKFRNPQSTLLNQRFLKAAMADPVRGVLIAGRRAAATGIRTARRMVSTIRISVSKMA
jgi:glycosyltransferase involved in cell wall biosynthesis